jgi:hypothetical protein
MPSVRQDGQRQTFASERQIWRGSGGIARGESSKSKKPGAFSRCGSTGSKFMTMKSTCPCRKPNSAGKRSRIAQCFCLISEACSLIWSALVLLFWSRTSLAAEILVLRHQDQHTETAFSQEADVQRHGPLDLCRAVSIGSNSPARSGGFEDRSLPPRPGRAVPPICSDLIYDRHKRRLDHENRKTPISKPAANDQRPNVHAEMTRRGCGGLGPAGSRGIDPSLQLVPCGGR